MRAAANCVQREETVRALLRLRLRPILHYSSLRQLLPRVSPYWSANRCSELIDAETIWFNDWIQFLTCSSRRRRCAVWRMISVHIHIMHAIQSRSARHTSHCVSNERRRARSVKHDTQLALRSSSRLFIAGFMLRHSSPSDTANEMMFDEYLSSTNLQPVFAHAKSHYRPYPYCRHSDR